MKELLQIYTAWFKMGLFTFGGGYAMLPMIQKEAIEKHHWATEDEILDYYAVGQCTPGIIAVNTATFVGYKIKGILGSIFATLGVISPSLIIIFLISTLIKNFAELEVVQHALQGIQVAVCALMVNAIMNLFKKGVKDIPTALIFVGSFLLAHFTSIPTIFIVLLAGVCGYVLHFAKNRKEGVA